MKKVAIVIFVLFSLNGFSQNATIRASEFNLEKKVAIQGYDPVAYFKEDTAIKGNKEFEFAYKGVIYYFASAVNKQYFIHSPSAYEPQYGGWCAFAMGNSAEKVTIDPDTFKIINEKLYLFYNAYFNNTLKSWNKDQSNLIVKADLNWKQFIQKN
jgi:YHS domain-containing protein